MYVCGPTVYDRPHIGNARSTVIYDLLFRVLRHLYTPEHVLYVRNITDVDDKINIAAKERKISINELTEEVIGYFDHDMSALYCLTPNIEPKATEHIQEMIDIITKLISSNNAYIADHHVYFDVTSYKDYTGLSGRSLDELISGSRIEINEHKRHPADFVLWKPSDQDDDPSAIFVSPWGDGRPGWHIECSAMSTKYLGYDFDIHGGGADLIFPHHTNEIAQSRCCFAHSIYAKYWVHNGFLTVNGEKMSKSLGNFFTVKELLDRDIKGEVMRYVLLATHYRKPLNWNDKAVDDAKKTLDGFYRIVEKSSAGPTCESHEVCSVEKDLCDDLNTPAALATLHAIAKDFHKSSDEAKKVMLANDLYHAGKLMGFFNVDSQQWFARSDNTHIDSLIAKRIEAKQNQDWKMADQIRDELKSLNIVLEDKPDGTCFWRKI